MRAYLAIIGFVIALAGTPVAVRADDATALAANADLALRLANLLRSARSIIATEQDNINNAEIGDKGLSGDVVLGRALALYRQRYDDVPTTGDGGTAKDRIIAALIDLIDQVMDENQPAVNRKGVGFKGFVPAVFARLVNERFGDKVGEWAEMKVTAPEHLVRNVTARPDHWEMSVITTELTRDDWPRGRIFIEHAPKGGRPAVRVLVPEYYSAGCLACHGGPVGELDITGHPKEGGSLGQLGGVISVTLYQMNDAVR